MENHPETLGNKSSPKLPQVIRLTASKQEMLRDFQLVADVCLAGAVCLIFLNTSFLTGDLTVIMTEIFPLNLQEESVVQEIVQQYLKTPTFAFIRENILE